MLTLVFILIGLLLATAQTTFFMLGPLWSAAPDLYYILVAYTACQFSLCRGIIILLPVSCVMDVYSGTIVGLHPALCGCGWLLLKFMTLKMPVRRPLYQLPLVAASYLLVSWLAALLIDLLQQTEEMTWSWPLMLFRASLLFLFSYPLFRSFDFLNSKLSGRFFFTKTDGSAAQGNQFRQEKKLQ